MYLETFFFFVPNRLVWDNWERFNGARDEPESSIDYTVPTMAPLLPSASETLWDYFGFPIGQLTTEITPNAMPFRAYNLIYNEWFRDQNICQRAPFSTDDGPDTNSYAV